MGSYSLEETSLPLKDLGVLQRGLAPITSADLFKPNAFLRKPKSTINISHFLSSEAQIRQPSSLKASAAGLDENVVSLSTGRPSPKTYPFEQAVFEFASSFSASRQDSSSRRLPSATVYKEDPVSSIDLSTALSYGYSLGSEQLIQFLTTHVSHIHSPPYSDWEICLSIGNTSALEIALRNFANNSDSILVEQYTYSGMIEASKALGLHLISVAMDSDGLCPVALNESLSSWSLRYPGKPKPKLLYTIPTGHNPTGITQSRNRRLEVLTVAERHNLLIIEDDPYYYLHFSQPDAGLESPRIPSYLSLSPTGRVLRLDTTSKILAPGLRLGWLTAPKAVVATFQAAHDLGIVHPSGPSQLIVYELLSETWGHDGFAQWLSQLAKEYHRKSIVMTQALRRTLGFRTLKDICSWDNIEAGMFIWLKIDCKRYPGFKDPASSRLTEDLSLASIEEHIFAQALKAGVLCCKGSFFRAPGLSLDERGQWEDGHAERLVIENPSIHLRLTFASVEDVDLVKGVERLAIALREVFALHE